MHFWKVVPICERQRRDVRPEDLVVGGHFRLCDTYRGGGGYDQFPRVCEQRLNLRGYSRQFVVQLKGCHLACPYCYVTPEGINGPHVEYDSVALAYEFFKTNANVFHLMGGAPALQIEHWPELIDYIARLGVHRDWVFHSDLLLTEKVYPVHAVRQLAKQRCLYAVDVKGVTEEEHLLNTGRSLNTYLFWDNLAKLEAFKVPYYVTFTNVNRYRAAWFWHNFNKTFPESFNRQFSDAFDIDLIQYKALTV